ncbi:MAG: HPr family phosphocarrier protein [Peptostreptococcaceae bacterium]|nr:HPr family phosphocarrier protein [Peptostreptococcaceae bacterium]
MISKKATVNNSIGLHARPAARFVQMANKFDSEISIRKDNQEINGKSIIGIMAVGIAAGEILEIVAQGHDEEEAVDSLVDLLENQLQGKR